jgi:hypothetical protein
MVPFGSIQSDHQRSGTSSPRLYLPRKNPNRNTDSKTAPQQLLHARTIPIPAQRCPCGLAVETSELSIPLLGFCDVFLCVL